MPVLGCPSLEESYPSLANQSSAWGQAGWSKGGRGSTPAWRISFVSLVAYSPKVFLLSLSHGGLQLLKPGRAVPNKLKWEQFQQHLEHEHSWLQESEQEWVGVAWQCLREQQGSHCSWHAVSMRELLGDKSQRVWKEEIIVYNEEK